jgi:hypothetical protein
VVICAKLERAFWSASHALTVGEDFKKRWVMVYLLEAAPAGAS